MVGNRLRLRRLVNLFDYVGILGTGRLPSTPQGGIALCELLSGPATAGLFLPSD